LIYDYVHKRDFPFLIIYQENDFVEVEHPKDMKELKQEIDHLSQFLTNDGEIFICEIKDHICEENVPSKTAFCPYCGSDHISYDILSDLYVCNTCSSILNSEELEYEIL